MAELKARIEAEIKNGGKIVLTKNNYGRQDLIDILVFSGYTLKIYHDDTEKDNETVVILFWKE